MLEAERACVAGAVEKRQAEFLQGRTLARRALAALGAEGHAPLLPGARRAPIWPNGVVGSITHTDGYCAAVVAWARDLRGIGIDAETVDRLEAKLWPQILTPGELTLANRLTPAAGQERAALIFSAKEAYFKAQYPLTAVFLGFGDVEVSVGEGRFTALAQPEAARSLGPVEGRYARSGPMIFTVAVIPAAGS